MKITVQANQRKMSPEELQAHLKNKRQGHVHKNKKAYNRKGV